MKSSGRQSKQSNHQHNKERDEMDIKMRHYKIKKDRYKQTAA